MADTASLQTRDAAGGACPWGGAIHICSWHFMVAQQIFPEKEGQHQPERLPVTPKACRIRWRAFGATEGQALPGGNKLRLFRAGGTIEYRFKESQKRYPALPQ